MIGSRLMYEDLTDSERETAVRVCNAAFVYSDVPGRLEAFPDYTEVSGDTAARLYDLTRKELLRTHSWSFALVTAALSELTIPAAERHPLYANAYVFPPDSLKVVNVHNRDTDDPVPHKIETRANGVKAVFANAPGLYIRYVREGVKDGFDPMFEGCFSLLLATKFVVSFSKPTALGQRLNLEYRQALAVAESADSSESYEDPERTASWIEARY